MVKTIVAAPFGAAMALVLAGGCVHAQTAPPPQPYRCTADAHRAFDFWIGAWDVVVTGTDNAAGRSLVASEDGGCVITEHWVSVGAGAPFSGRSLNMYDATTGAWVQVWMDAGGEITRFSGGPTPEGMVLTAADERRPGQDRPFTVRMTFTRLPDGAVRQRGERTDDGGATWRTTYDFTYRRRAS